MLGAIRTLAGLFACVALVDCGAVRAPSLGPDELVLLRLEYLERAPLLPALNLDRIELPVQKRLGLFSPMVWRIRSDMLPGREVFRPLPIEDVDLLLYRSMVRTLEDYGFNVSHWQIPDLRLRVDVEKLVLSSEDRPTDRRACEMSLVFRVEELPAGLEIKRFRGKASLELPGSWTVARGEEIIWLPRENAPDPIAMAATAATERFLIESLEFWKTPKLWRDGTIQLTAAGRRSVPILW